MFKHRVIKQHMPLFLLHGAAGVVAGRSSIRERKDKKEHSAIHNKEENTVHTVYIFPCCKSNSIMYK